jgi:DNA modification methylase
MTAKPKLELTWIGKETRPRLEPRILIEDPEKSYHARYRIKNFTTESTEDTEGKKGNVSPSSPFSSSVNSVSSVVNPSSGDLFDNKLIFGDKLLALKALEAEYTGKVKCVFIDPPYNTGSAFTHYDDGVEHSLWLGLMRDRLELIKRLMSEDGSLWITIDDNECHYLKVLCDEVYGRDKFVAGIVWQNRYSRSNHASISLSHNTVLVYATKSFKQYLQDAGPIVPNTWWPHEDAGHSDEAKKEIQAIFGKADVFDTPKPERLLNRIMQIATNPGDLVLDSFAGSGTTGAVARKMGRRWIMVELGEHCHTHIIPRLQKVIDGQDPGCITDAVSWKGGGGFRYYRLAPSLLEKDKWGNWVINKEYNAAMLAEALCKLEGFIYAPSETEYFIHGHSTETDFIWVTTQNLGHEQLAALSEDVGSNRTLLVLCSAYRADVNQFPNLTVKKIPNAVLSKCEWGHDDYSLQVENLPSAPKPKVDQPDLFGGDA